jgi:SAM-dependent methyltransferase
MNVPTYRLLHAVGIRPWAWVARRGDAPRRLAAILDAEQAGAPPYGRALDLGCGTGLHSVDLARRGWQVTGVDIVPAAVRLAVDRARRAGVDARFVCGDVTALSASGIGADFRLVLDFGAFHGLTDPERAAMAREVTAITAPGAILLMVAFVPGRRGPAPRGADRADIEAAFTGWTVLTEQPLPTQVIGALRLYRLRRGDQP